MKRLEVIVTEDVLLQIHEQVLFIATDSVENALRWEERLLKSLDDLGTSHGHAIDTKASARIGGVVRKMVFQRTYLIHYRVNDAENRVEVVNFRHGARLPRSGEP